VFFLSLQCSVSWKSCRAKIDFSHVWQKKILPSEVKFISTASPQFSYKKVVLWRCVEATGLLSSQWQWLTSWIPDFLTGHKKDSLVIPNLSTNVLMLFLRLNCWNWERGIPLSKQRRVTFLLDDACLFAQCSDERLCTCVKYSFVRPLRHSEI
jgi:hypothetical protein